MAVSEFWGTAGEVGKGKKVSPYTLTSQPTVVSTGNQDLSASGLHPAASQVYYGSRFMREQGSRGYSSQEIDGDMAFQGLGEGAEGRERENEA